MHRPHGDSRKCSLWYNRINAIAAPDPIYGGATRVFVSVPHQIPGTSRRRTESSVKQSAILASGETAIDAAWRSSATSKSWTWGRKRLADDLQRANDALPNGRPCERQPLAFLKFTSDESAGSERPPALFTVSAENAAESPVQNSKKRVKCAFQSALHNPLGGLT